MRQDSVNTCFMAELPKLALGPPRLTAQTMAGDSVGQQLKNSAADGIKVGTMIGCRS